MKVIVITGASSGIGAQLARRLAASDTALVLAARRLEALQAVATDCEARGAQTLCVAADVGVKGQCGALIEQALAKFGRLDVLVNNAGVSAHALFADVSDLQWYEDLMRINLWGSVWCTHAALPHLKASKGQIVAVSSLAGLIGVPGRTAYSATKFAMTGFFEALRAELKPAGVAVTTAYPGVVATEIRRNGWNAQGLRAGFSSLKEDSAMSVDECVHLIIEGMNRREREVVMTGKGKLGRWLKLIAPGKAEDMALSAVANELRPH